MNAYQILSHNPAGLRIHTSRGHETYMVPTGLEICLDSAELAEMKELLMMVRVGTNSYKRVQIHSMTVREAGFDHRVYFCKAGPNRPVSGADLEDAYGPRWKGDWARKCVPNCYQNRVYENVITEERSHV